MKTEFEFIPLKKVGMFLFGSSIKNYVEDDFKKVINNDKTEWDSYFYKDTGLVLYTEKESIVSIACHKECVIGGVNVIGMQIGEFVNNYNYYPDLNLTDTIFLSNDKTKPHIVYEFDKLGMQAWVKDGLIVSVFCSDE